MPGPREAKKTTSGVQTNGTTPLDYSALLTEAKNERARDLDALEPLGIVELLVGEELATPQAVLREKESIARAAERIADAFRSGGRLIYIGAGTSGRLGNLDAAECPPTFSAPPEQVVPIIAGGPRALVRAVEGAEDRPRDAEARLKKVKLAPRDVVCAIAASGVTPYAHAALAFARKRGAQTIFVTCAPPKDAHLLADEVIAPRVGPEVLSGSTRLKAGTATKIVLNALTTTAMVRIGKVYGNLMVDMKPTNVKLRARARRILHELCGVDDKQADKLLTRSGGSLKLAVLMHHRGVPLREARALLEEAGGRLRVLIGEVRTADGEVRRP